MAVRNERAEPAVGLDRRLAVAAAALVYFGLVFCLGFALGVLRVAVVAPLVGEVGAVSIEAPLMLAASWLVCGWTVRLFDVEANLAARIAMGAIAFALLMGAELAVGVLLFALDPLTALQAWATPAGVIGLVSQVGFAFIPLLQRRPGKP